MKIAVIGAGSSYTPELINGFLERQNSLPLSELWMMDVSQSRLDVVGGFAQRMVAAKAAGFTVELTTDQREAVRDADYVITQLRVGGMEARRNDEYLGHRHGLIGQETTGVGGMANALRTIPVILDIAEDMRELAPDALLVNFANPAGLVTQALSQYIPEVDSVGVCNVAINMKMTILEMLRERLSTEIDPAGAYLDTLGLNHLSWHRGFVVGDRDYWPEIMEAFIAQLEETPDPEWDLQTIKTLNMIPNYYLEYYYYTGKKLAAQQKWPPSRAEEVMQIEDGLLDKYAEPERTEPPEMLMERGGAYYSTVATQLLNAHHNDLNEVHTTNVTNNGAVAAWPDEWVLEIPCRVGAEGVTPLSTEPLPEACYGLLAHVKAYELLTAQAAVEGDRDAAYRALLAHPLGPAANRVGLVLDDMLETNREYLPRFWD